MSAAPSSSALGHCVVCGKESTTACSACKKAGLDWMFFCSKDHQRLIWKTHRLVCGKNPFEYPSLSAKEVEQLWKARNDPSVTSSSLSDLFKQTAGANVEIKSWAGEDTLLRDDRLESLLEIQLSDLNTKNPREALRQGPLRIYREVFFGSNLMRFHVANGGTKTKEVLMLLRNHPLAFMAFVEQFIREQDLNLSWYQASFRHRLFIFIGVIAADQRDTLSATPAEAWHLNRVIHFSKEYVPRIDSDSAHCLDECFLPRILKLIGIRLTVDARHCV
ncbi:hypothetical protein JCM5350_000040 [Sporobolomyces pararoseus]